MPVHPALVVTLGDPRGIGPEVVAAALGTLAASGEIAAEGVRVIGARGLEIGGFPFHEAGSSNGSEVSAGRVARRAIEMGARICDREAGTILVTGPVHKGALRAAGVEHPGQTEMLQELTGAAEVGMLMAAERTRTGPPLRVLLATTHLALRDVADQVSTELLVRQTRLLDQELRERWRIPSPRLALCALNPHASDGGLFGDEEERVYTPALAELARLGSHVDGPIPADTVFSRALAGEFDAVVAPYHDVGMAAFKTVTFGSGVNVTLGLPFVRTSPDHGTAFDLVGTGRADPSSMVEAIRLGLRLSRDAAPVRLPSGTEL